MRAGYAPLAANHSYGYASCLHVRPVITCPALYIRNLIKNPGWSQTLRPWVAGGKVDREGNLPDTKSRECGRQWARLRGPLETWGCLSTMVVQACNGSTGSGKPAPVGIDPVTMFATM